jgi:hypothetical protein
MEILLTALKPCFEWRDESATACYELRRQALRKSCMAMKLIETDWLRLWADVGLT